MHTLITRSVVETVCVTCATNSQTQLPTAHTLWGFSRLTSAWLTRADRHTHAPGGLLPLGSTSVVVNEILSTMGCAPALPPVSV